MGGRKRLSGVSIAQLVARVVLRTRSRCIAARFEVSCSELNTYITNVNQFGRLVIARLSCLWQFSVATLQLNDTQANSATNQTNSLSARSPQAGKSVSSFQFGSKAGTRSQVFSTIPGREAAAVRSIMSVHGDKWSTQ